jgi:hypothetical protein
MEGLGQQNEVRPRGSELMCQASKVTNDWAVKGCHIHIGAVELVIFPDHLGGVGFKTFFTVTSEDLPAVKKALKMAREECLPDEKVRSLWVRSLRQAIRYMLSFEGEPSAKANGRMLEFKFLILALERYAG